MFFTAKVSYYTVTVIVTFLIVSFLYSEHRGVLLNLDCSIRVIYELFSCKSYHKDTCMLFIIAFIVVPVILPVDCKA